MYIIGLYLAVGIVLWRFIYAKSIIAGALRYCDQHNYVYNSDDVRFATRFVGVTTTLLWPIMLVFSVYDFMYNLVLRISLFFED